MEERRWGRTFDFIGLVAYLTIMYGRLPDRRMLSATYDAAGQIGSPRGRAFTVVPATGEQAPQQTDAGERVEFAA